MNNGLLVLFCFFIFSCRSFVYTPLNGIETGYAVNLAKQNLLNQKIYVEINSLDVKIYSNSVILNFEKKIKKLLKTQGAIVIENIADLTERDIMLDINIKHIYEREHIFNIISEQIFEININTKNKYNGLIFNDSRIIRYVVKRDFNPLVVILNNESKGENIKQYTEDIYKFIIHTVSVSFLKIEWK